jgi:hypothetical protein
MTAGVRYPTPPGRSTGRQPRFLILEGITMPVGMVDRPHIAGLQFAVAAEGFVELGARVTWASGREEAFRELAVPRGAFGVTNDPEELVHLVFDGLERGRA